MVSLGLEPGAAGWKAQANPLSFVVLFFRLGISYVRDLSAYSKTHLKFLFYLSSSDESCHAFHEVEKT